MLLNVTLVMDFYALWYETLASDAAAAAQDIASVLGLHAGTESKLALPGALGGLISSFRHKRVGGVE